MLKIKKILHPYKQLFFCFFLFFIFFCVFFLYTKAIFATKNISTELQKNDAAIKKQIPSILTPLPRSPISSFYIPAPPAVNAKGYILLDANSGYVIAESNADARLSPASLTKLTSLYILGRALKEKKLRLSDLVTISEKAWRTGGSKMFIKIGSQVPLNELIDGTVVASGNDSTVAFAEHIAGSEQAFVDMMNSVVAQLHMNNTHYVDSNGLPAEAHYSSARDISKIAVAFIQDLPEYYGVWFQKKWITYNGIKQPNRNRLLWRDSSVDGIKTGHTDEAGYCLIASAVKNGMRLISVVLGAPSDSTRFNYSEALLNYGFRFYNSYKLYTEKSELSKVKIWIGDKSKVPVGVVSDLYVTALANQYEKMSINLTIDKVIKAPVKQGQIVGELNVILEGKVLAKTKIVALEDVQVSYSPRALIDRVILMFN